MAVVLVAPIRLLRRACVPRIKRLTNNGSACSAAVGFYRLIRSVGRPKMSIPKKVKLTGKNTWDVILADHFPKHGDDQTVGYCDDENKILFVYMHQTKKQKMCTFIHELIHAMELEYDFKLTENQVKKLEVAVYKVLKLNKWLRLST